MKGLWIKDIKLMKMQKNFFFAILAISIAVAVFADDISFTVGFPAFVLSMFTLSTISYDEFDNGNAFLFSLPITRKLYVVEKYAFGLFLGCGGLLLSALLTMIASSVKGVAQPTDILTVAFLILPLILLMQAVMLPFQLKLGGEKGRLVIIASIGLIIVLGAVINTIAKIVNIEFSVVFSNLQAMSIGSLLFTASAAALLLLLISMKLSISIMKKKEF